jgi:hypothetical protein
VQHFPDWHQPWLVPFWSVMSTSEVVRYCFAPVGSILIPVGIVGALCLWRGGQRIWIGLALIPIGLAWLAALMKGYPYGGSRLEIFSAPGLAILIGAGISPIMSWTVPRFRWVLVVVVGSLLYPVGHGLWSTVMPWPRADVKGASVYIQAHWKPGDTVVANHWEYAYYFRQQEGNHSWLERDLPQPNRRVWVAFTAPDDAIRRHYGEYLTRFGPIVEQRDFTYTTVFLLDTHAKMMVEHRGHGRDSK